MNSAVPSGVRTPFAPDSRGPEIPQRENSGPLLSDAENSLEAPEAGLLSNLHTDEPDTSMPGEAADGVQNTDGAKQ